MVRSDSRSENGMVGMAVGRAKTPKELAELLTWEEHPTVVAARQAALQQERAAAERQVLLGTPLGQARDAYEAGSTVLQVALEVLDQRAVVVPMTGAYTLQRTADPTVVLDAICREGWELVSGSFVFEQQLERSRDKLLASGQQVAIEGRTMGYYLFKRSPGMKSTPGSGDAHGAPDLPSGQ